MVEGQAQNLTVVPAQPVSPDPVKPKPVLPSFETTGDRLLQTQNGRVRVGPVGKTVVALREGPGQGLQTGNKMVLYEGTLWLDGQQDRAALLIHFNLGAQYAQRSVTVYHLNNGTQKAYHLRANDQGLVSLTVTSLGSFACVLD